MKSNNVDTDPSWEYGEGGHELSRNEVLWVVSKSLLTVSKRCNQGVENVALARYRAEDTDLDAEKMRNQLQFAIDELELALESIAELDEEYPETDGE